MQRINSYVSKYNKYKAKYLNLKRLVRQQKGGSIFIPVVEFYEYRIENYAQNNEKNSFINGFTTTKTCGVVSTASAINNTNSSKTNISSCDILTSNGNNNEVNNTTIPVETAQFYKYLYSAYKLFNSRTELTDIDPNIDTFCNLYYSEIVNISNKIVAMYTPLIKDTQYDNSYVQIIKVKPSERIVVFGDIHGSLHSFVRLLFRLHSYNVLDITTFKVKNDYRIVFLGDVVDRGVFSLEIVFTILLLIYNNNDDIFNPKVIYNRGNHEEISVNSSQGLMQELNTRCSNKDLHRVFNNVFDILPSAVVIIVNGYRLWLAHGGFSINHITNKIDLSQHTSILNSSDGRQTRWADFSQYNGDSYKDIIPNTNRGIDQNETGTDVLVFNRRHVASFLDANAINFIIRGHQDNYFNSYIFSNRRINENVCAVGISEGTKYGIDKTLVYNDNLANNMKRTVGPIARLVIDKNYYDKTTDNEPYYYKKTGDVEIYPVLTLSTNTDRSRSLQCDSFAVVRFDLNANNIADFNSTILFTELTDLPQLN